jgi:enamine deaminase RidA (YjgF/YER057c/UK114 family)
MEIKKYASGVQFEETFGYSRAVQIGPHIRISGTTAIENGIVSHPNDTYKQAIVVLNKIKSVLENAGAKLEDVVQTRIFCTNMDDIDEIAKAHSEFFGSIKPASTLVEVSRLILGARIEIEADAMMKEG